MPYSFNPFTGTFDFYAASGPPGTTILTGSGAPAPSVGVDGNYYLDTTAGTLYGPKTTQTFLPPETILTGTAGTATITPLRLGNTYKALVAGQIVAGRFWRASNIVETTHTVYLWDQTHTLVATSVASAEGAGSSGYVQVSFPTPFTVPAGQQFTVATDIGGYVYSTTDYAVLHPAYVTFVNGNDGTSGAGFPGNITANNHYVDVSWRPSPGLIWPVALQSGTLILTGTGTPTGTTGADGNYYLDTAAHILYGPRAAGAWPVALKGAP